MDCVLGIGTSLMVEENKKPERRNRKEPSQTSRALKKVFSKVDRLHGEYRNVSIEVRMSQKPSSEAAANKELKRTVTVR
jgi:hypothetical protein